MNVVLPTVSHAQIIVGGPASGKTNALIAQATERATSSKDASIRVLYVCANPSSRTYIRTALPESIAVCTPEDIAQAILAEAHQPNRILEHYEEQFLFEDLRTTGLPQKQLRRILGFVYANYATLGTWDDSWIEMHEERLVHETLQANLRFTEGVCRAEASNHAARLLYEGPQLAEKMGYDHVMVDDYTALSRASQVLCNLVARESISVAGEPGHIPCTVEPYPYADGLQELRVSCPEAQITQLPSVPLQQRENNLDAETVREELEAICLQVRQWLAEGAKPQNIAIVATNGIWRKNLMHALREAGFGIARQPFDLHISNLTDAVSCKRIARDALAKLAANPHDSVALRSLAGLDDHLARSVELMRLREKHPGRTLADIHAEAPLAYITDSMSRFAMRKDDRASSAQDADPCGDSGIFVGKPEDLTGHRFDFVVFGGFVQGWVPARAYYDSVGSQKKRFLAKAQDQIACARRAAKREVLFTSFKTCDLEFAERLDLHFDHIRLVNGVRTCSLLKTDV